MRLAFVALPMVSGLALWGQTTPTYQILSAVPTSIAAGAAGATIALTGNLPEFATGAYQVCFYTGSGSNAALTPTLVQGANTISVPATTIQAIPVSSFTAANGYAVPASVYVVLSGSVCNGTSDPTLTNSLTVAVVEPTLGAYSGPTDIPQTNSATNVASPPASLTLAGNNFVAATTVTFGTFGSVTPKSVDADFAQRDRAGGVFRIGAGCDRVADSLQQRRSDLFLQHSGASDHAHSPCSDAKRGDYYRDADAGDHCGSNRDYRPV